DKRQLHSLKLVPEMAAVDVELGRIGALKTEDRLFFIANGEKCAWRLATSGFTGKKFFRKRSDNRPLLRTGVLGFIDQNMVQTLVQLEQHPGRGLATFQQF